MEAVSLMAFVIVFKSSFLLFIMFTAVKESVCIVISFLVSLAFSSATRMAAIFISSTEAESLILMIIFSSLCTTAAATRVSSLLRCRLAENRCILVISVSVLPFPPESSLSYIRMVVVPVVRCCVFVVVLVPPIVFIRVGDIHVSQ